MARDQNDSDSIPDITGADDPSLILDHRSGRKWTPEQAMLCRMLSDSIRGGRMGDQGEIEWLLSDCPRNPYGFSFLQVCHYLHLSPHQVRKLISKELVSWGAP